MGGEESGRTNELPEAWAAEGLYASTGFLLAMAGAESRKRWARGLARCGLRPAHYGLLMLLQQSPRSQQDVAASLGIDPRNLVPIIDQLQTGKLVERAPNPGDRRQNLVMLTVEGRQSLYELRKQGQAIEREMLAPLTSAEQATLKSLLTKLLLPAP